MIRKNSHLRIARYHQHLHELLDLDLSPLEYMMNSFPEVKEREEMRKIIGRYGLTGRQQVSYFSSNYIRNNLKVHFLIGMPNSSTK